MNLPPAWKVRREIKRIRDKAELASTDLYEPFLRFRHEKWIRDVAVPLRGEITQQDKVAVLVLYQPEGVAKSTLFTCNHLIAQGYSPFILSNTRLKEADRKALLARCTFILERPNFGYDFGAYQDGIRLLAKIDCTPNRLILMNDSTWFPLRDGDTSIERMEASGDSFTGLAFRDDPKSGGGREHIESHLLMFDRRALLSSAFHKFWHEYRMSSHRVKTIKFGEAGITSAMLKDGFSSQGLASRESLLAELANTSFDNMCRILLEACPSTVSIDEDIKNLRTDAVNNDAWRRQVLEGLDTILFSLAPHLSTTFIYGSMLMLGQGFVKKSKEGQFHLARIKVLAMEASGDIAPLDPEVRAEMATAVYRWKRS